LLIKRRRLSQHNVVSFLVLTLELAAYRREETLGGRLMRMRGIAREQHVTIVTYQPGVSTD
jgi:hypothetical protein